MDAQKAFEICQLEVPYLRELAMTLPKDVFSTYMSERTKLLTTMCEKHPEFQEFLDAALKGANDCLITKKVEQLLGN